MENHAQGHGAVHDEVLAFERDLANVSASKELVEEDVMDLAARIKSIWLPQNVDLNNMRAWAADLFGVPSAEAVPFESLQASYQKRTIAPLQLYKLLTSVDMDPGTLNGYLCDMGRVAEMMYYLKDSLYCSNRCKLICATETSMALPLETNLGKYSGRALELNKPIHNLLLYLLEQLELHGYRRFEDSCYEQRLTSDGRSTHSWRKVMTIEEFIYKVCNKEDHYVQWLNMLIKDNVRPAVQYLKNCRDPEFQSLKFDRHIFSFRNGVYNCMADRFFPYGDPHLGDHIVAVNYFDQDFDTRWLDLVDWYNVPTPNLDRILQTQKLPEPVMRWIYVFIGRMLYNVNSVDQWQVILFIKGVAGCGKSTIGNVIASFYPGDTVGVMSSNIEKKFGLSALYQKLVWLCYEVKNNFNLETAEFQCVVSGEKMSIPVKHSTAITVNWEVPGMMMGNEVANWLDVQGAIARRVIIVEFIHKVLSQDPKLKDKLSEEIGAIIAKCNMAYRAACDQHGHEDVWLKLPDYFKITRTRMKCQTSSLTAFIENHDGLEKHVDKYIPLKRFKEMYNEFCQTMGYGKPPPWHADHYQSIFEENCLAMVKCVKEWEGKPVDQSYIVGIGFKGNK